MATSLQLIDGPSYHHNQLHNRIPIKLVADQLPDQLPVLRIFPISMRPATRMVQNFSTWNPPTSYPSSYPNNMLTTIQISSANYLQLHLLLHHDYLQQTNYNRAPTVLWTLRCHCSEAQTTNKYHRYMKSGSTLSINCTNPSHSPDQVQHLPHDTVFQSTHNMTTALDYQFQESHQQSQFIVQTVTSLLQNYTMDNMPYWWILDRATI